jgi:hypothetical protein
MVFGHFLDHHSKYFDETWSEVRKNGEEAGAKDSRLSFATIREIFSVKYSQNRPKSTKLY